MGQVKQYDREYKEEALKLVEEKGCKNASEELGISYNTLYGWVKEARKGNLHLGKRSDSNVSKLEEELQQLRRATKEQAKEIKRKAMENSVEIRTQNTTIMNNLKAVGDMINVVLEKGLQY